MNLFAYDRIKEPAGNALLNNKRRTIVTKDIKYRPYNLVLKKYNPEQDTTDYYIAMFDEKLDTEPCNRTIVDDYGRIKIYLNGIFDDVRKTKSIRNTSVKIRLVEPADDSDVYIIDNLLLISPITVKGCWTYFISNTPVEEYAIRQTALVGTTNNSIDNTYSAIHTLLCYSDSV